MENWNGFFMSIGIGGLAAISINDAMSIIFYALSIIGLIVNLIKQYKTWNK